MISNVQQSIIIRAVKIRRNWGEEPTAILAGYVNLTEDERVKILELVKKG